MIAPSHIVAPSYSTLVYRQRQLPVILLSLCHRSNLLSFYGISRHSASIAYLTARKHRHPPRPLLSLFPFTPQRRKTPPFCGLTSVNDARGKRHASVMTTLSAPCCLLRAANVWLPACVPLSSSLWQPAWSPDFCSPFSSSWSCLRSTSQNTRSNTHGM